MSRSRKKPLPGTKNTYRDEICCCGDHSTNIWKREYNRNMRHKNHQHETVLSKIDGEEIDDDETPWLNKPALTSNGNEWNSPGDGWVLRTEEDVESWTPGKGYHLHMK